MNEQRKRITYQEPPAYPSYDQALAYAQDFRNGAPGSYLKGDRYARYWLTASLDVSTTLLATDIFSVVAYPPAGFEVAYASDIEGYEHFRGWIFRYDPFTDKWTCLHQSEHTGIEEFKRLRREYKAS